MGAGVLDGEGKRNRFGVCPGGRGAGPCAGLGGQWGAGMSSRGCEGNKGNRWPPVVSVVVVVRRLTRVLQETRVVRAYAAYTMADNAPIPRTYIASNYNIFFYAFLANTRVIIIFFVYFGKVATFFGRRRRRRRRGRRTLTTYQMLQRGCKIGRLFTGCFLLSLNAGCDHVTSSSACTASPRRCSGPAVHTRAACAR